MIIRLVVICIGLLASAQVGATGTLQVTTSTTSFSEGFHGELERVVASHRGVMGVSLKHLETGEEIAVNGDELFPTASTIKLAVMTAAFEMLVRGDGPFDDYYDTMPYDASTSQSGSGFLQKFRDGTKIELKELMHLMITVSDNIATNMIVEWMGGLEPVNDWLKRHGLEHTKMASTVGGKIIWSPEIRSTWGLGVTTPNEMCRLMEMIVKGEAGTTSTTDEMLRLLGHQYFDGGLPAGVPPTVYVGSKGGALSRSRSDVGVVHGPAGPYVLSIFTKDNQDTSWGRTNEAEAKIWEISRLVWKHHHPQSTWTRPAGAQNF